MLNLLLPNGVPLKYLQFIIYENPIRRPQWIRFIYWIFFLLTVRTSIPTNPFHDPFANVPIDSPFSPNTYSKLIKNRVLDQILNFVKIKSKKQSILRKVALLGHPDNNLMNETVKLVYFTNTFDNHIWFGLYVLLVIVTI